MDGGTFEDVEDEEAAHRGIFINNISPPIWTTFSCQSYEAEVACMTPPYCHFTSQSWEQGAWPSSSSSFPGSACNNGDRPGSRG